MRRELGIGVSRVEFDTFEHVQALQRGDPTRRVAGIGRVGDAGFRARPGEDLRAAAEAAGLKFLDLPFSGPRATPDQVRAFADLLASGDDRVAAFCKSGMRSALLWGAASIANGRSLEQVLQGARNAGQELSGVAELMTGLAQAARP